VWGSDQRNRAWVNRATASPSGQLQIE
jgi:hypothetical protein